MTVGSRIAEVVPPASAAIERDVTAPRFDNINLLRAFAALAVVVYHVIEHSKWTAYPSDGPLVTFRIGMCQSQPQSTRRLTKVMG